MKTSIASKLSIAAVLAAGIAAFTVNTSVLGAPSKSRTAADASAVVRQTAASTESDVNTNVSVLSAIDSTTTYQVGSSGSVLIDTSTGTPVIKNVLPSAGWTSEPATSSTNDSAEVNFSNSASRVIFTAQLVNGKTQVTSNLVTTNSPSAKLASPAGAPPFGDDDGVEVEHHDSDSDSKSGDDDGVEVEHHDSDSDSDD